MHCTMVGYMFSNNQPSYTCKRECMERERFLLSQDYIQFHGKCHRIASVMKSAFFHEVFEWTTHSKSSATICRKHILPACGLAQQVSYFLYCGHFRISHVNLNFEFVRSLRFISLTVYRFFIHSTFHPLSLQLNLLHFSNISISWE